MAITYPRPCPICGTKIKNRGNFFRHKKYCGTNTRAPCLHCQKKTFCRKDKMVAHVKKCHSEAAKRKAEESAELLRLELLNSGKIPRLDVEEQTGGAVSTRGTKRSAEDSNPDVKMAKGEPESSETKTDGGTGPLFQANIAKMGTPKKWKKGKVIDQKFTFTLDYVRDPKPEEDLGVEAVYALTEGMDTMVEDMEIDLKNYDLALQIGSKEHFKESSNTGETWHIPADDYFHRLQMTQSMLDHIARVLNSGEFSSDRGFSASMTLLRRDVKGGKRAGYKPGAKIWEEVVKELRCVHEIKNKDKLCCGRAIVVMREYAKKKAGEKNCYENIRQDRGKNSQQLKEAKQLYAAAGVPEGSCGYEEIQKFQDYLGPMGYQLIVVDPVRGGVIFTGEQYKFAPKVIQIVKTYYEDSDGKTKAHYDGLYSVAAVMNRCKFCRYCCKGYNTEDAKHHNCLHANCPSCMRRRNEKSEGCPDYTGWSKPTITCRTCGRSFYGEDCYRDHLVQKKKEESKMEKDLIKEVALDNDLTIPPQKPMKSVCEMHRKCHTCMVSYKVKQGMSHKCGHGQCANCLNYVDLYNHQCFIMSDIYKANKRYDNKQKAEERIREAIKEMTTEEGKKVKEAAKNPITIKERLDAMARKKPPTQDEQIAYEQSRQETIEAVKKKLQDLGVDVTEIPEDHLQEFQWEHFSLTEGQKDKQKELVFADIECCIDDQRQFTPNLICFERETSDEKYQCWGRTCLRDFYNRLMAMLKELEKENNLRWNQLEMQVYFHNFRGFDGVFIIKQLYDMNLKVSKVLMTGQKILYFECDRLKFKDSMSFLNMPLENFTKTFGLTELKKGYFPHSFNRKENQDYEGPLPDLKYYETNCMNTKKKEAVEKWHGEEVLKGESWNFKKELLEYCESDVKLLKEGCLTFAADFEKECKFNPLKENITIASACHNFWRNNQMIPYSIAVEPPHGWSGVKPAQSKIGFQWLHIQDQKLGGNRIKHAANGGEQTLMIESWGKVRVDGYDPIKKTVFEFQGCEFHGCPKCKPNNRHVKTWHHPDRTVEEMYELTQKKTEVLRKAGYTVKVEWECNFKRKLVNDPTLQDMIKDLEWTAPLNPKEALFGGRTGAATLYSKTTEDEEISYVDYTSLYPWVNKYGTYPLGHPTILKNPEEQNIDRYFGVAKVDILAPEGLFHPVLPMKIDDKCMFTLCATCAQEQLEQPWHERTNLCNHIDKERLMIGVWCTEELKMAVQKGYRILKIHEVWHWSENKRKTGLFAPYVNKFLKAKQESAGWPSDCVTDQQKEAYIAEYEVHEGIKLDSDKIEVNPGRKAVAKVMLNSFWGKFGEGDNKPTTSTLQKVEDWEKNSKVKSIHLEDMIKIFQVNWDKRVVEKGTGVTYPYGYVRL
ncbi:unnamed protein product [Porites lobata]|uniref:DNA-directed DNA polymerase n=1 Tax=Porites lobata TaxID=104759 RepID=A0ABN8S8B8_9CNID|nr:unnamed protein product [Porites lobata]